jgi:RNA polymerase sigma-70 factor (ECF subfamily)
MVNLISAGKHPAGKLRPYNRGFVHVEVVLDRGLLIREAPSSSEQTLADIPEDARLVAAARGGDRTAFGQLYERHARLVHGVLMAHAPFAEVDDLVHDVFLTALRKLDSLREPAAFSGWLLAIARNRAVDFHRRSHATEELPEETSGHEPREYEARVALEAIRSLPEAYRETLVLRLVEGMTGPEIAARTGLTHASVRVNLHRGMKQLREKLGRSEANE